MAIKVVCVARNDKSWSLAFGESQTKQTTQKQKRLDTEGIDPSTSRMQSGRSTTDLSALKPLWIACFF